ncbi:hypothetical protein OPT61_g3845 [Boeremia exigua]|uniref:Uncharacterized protein n=1 Tax=Boeremia exigua TaxID=749465 RepID=A0ACC2IG80_9PLEO|nr:hypothetical protein OPT61_g3845 [Boeremia exigua]
MTRNTELEPQRTGDARTFAVVAMLFAAYGTLGKMMGLRFYFTTITTTSYIAGSRLRHCPIFQACDRWYAAGRMGYCWVAKLTTYLASGAVKNLTRIEQRKSSTQTRRRQGPHRPPPQDDLASTTGKIISTAPRIDQYWAGDAKRKAERRPVGGKLLVDESKGFKTHQNALCPLLRLPMGSHLEELDGLVDMNSGESRCCFYSAKSRWSLCLAASAKALSLCANVLGNEIREKG